MDTPAVPDSEPTKRHREAYPPRPWALLATLVVGYIGVYLCRKNFAVANPLIREAFGLNKEQIGQVASYGTVAYMVGKFAFGPIIDRAGGRVPFLLSLLGVAVFGALGGMVGSLAMLTAMYSVNRLAGAAGWGGMVKQVPDWFPARSMSFAMGILSLSFVFGGALATVLAGVIASRSGDDWRWVMSGPSIVLGLILLVCWAVLPRERRPLAAATAAPSSSDPSSLRRFAPSVGVLHSTSMRFRIDLRRVAEIAAVRRFWIVCALSFTLTLLRETFNVWTVDFFQTTGGPATSSAIAAFLATPFDALGAVGILTLGWLFGRIGHQTRMALLCAMLLTLALLIFALPTLAARNMLLATIGVGGIGFLAYGPYSLLAGVLAVETKGKENVATVAGILDGVGYFAAVLSGAAFGRILDLGGYRLGFNCLAALAAISGVLCLFLYDRAAVSADAVTAPSDLTLAT